ncbi:MAG TPA: phosphoribosyltransferase family protein [Chloroflexota bacterium]|nr:phosphoribosyltransferase family protein [Chloroflexota bacterium]
MQDDVDNLWLARTLHHLGAVRFGDFSRGRSTIHSPIYIDLKVMLGDPTVLRNAARLIQQETRFGQALRKPKVGWFDVVAGVPFGGLHLATAFSLETNTPLTYARQPKEDSESSHVIEGARSAGLSALIVDDLVTGGRSILETAALFRQEGLTVHDVIVLVDRDQGAGERLKQHGLNLISILKLPVMLNLYVAEGWISEDQHQRAVEYIRAARERAAESE